MYEERVIGAVYMSGPVATKDKLREVVLSLARLLRHTPWEVTAVLEDADTEEDLSPEEETQP
jgi:hypothetical protein